jgi:predicted ATPase
MISKLHIHNYKSLRNVDLVDVPPLMVLVGANASGKSNFADALHFLSLVFRGGLANAVRLKGGYENICFRRVRRSKKAIEFRVTAVAPARPRGKMVEFSYEFAFKATTEAIAADYVVTHEAMRVRSEDFPREEFSVTRTGNSTKVSCGKNIAKRLGFPASDPTFMRYLQEQADLVKEDELLVPNQAFLKRGLGDLFAGARLYQISPHMARQTGVPERSPELGQHGENLPAVVDHLSRVQPKAFEELVLHLQHTVPSMERLDTQYLETKQLGLFFTERGVGRRWFSQDVSDGTLQTVAAFLPLLDERVTIVVIEEPENSIHPWILRHFIDVCKETAAQKQIIITTHSPVAVNEVAPESLFISVRKRGETRILRAIDTFPETGQVISEALFGLGDYWDSGAISGVPQQGE